MHPPYRHGTPSEVEHELAVAVDADDIALVAGEGAGEYAQKGVVAGETLEGVAQEGEVVGVGAHHVHEGLHEAVGYGGRTARTAIVDEMVLGKMFFQEVLQVPDCALQKDKAADRRYLLLPDAALTLLVPVAVAEGLVDEKGLADGGLIVGVKPAVQPLGGHVLQEKITPGGGLVGRIFPRCRGLALGCSFYTRGRRMVSPDDVDALG